MTEPIRILRPSPARRALGLIVQLCLAVLLLWVAAAYPLAPGWRIVLAALGAAMLLLARAGWHGSAGALVLDAGGVREETGVPVAPLSEIAAIDRAVFALKPSNGFAIRLTRPLGRAWVPGLWWRLGARVGIGGVTGKAETTAFADALSALVADRDA